MKIAFLINRGNNFRHFSPVIEEALSRGHMVECWHDHFSTTKDSAKGYLFPDLSKSPFFTCTDPNFHARVFKTAVEHDRAILERTDIDYFVSLSPPEFIIGDMARQEFTGAWCLIMHGPDSFKELKNINPDQLARKCQKLFFPYTANFVDEGLKFLENHIPDGVNYLKSDNMEVHPVGCTMFGPKSHNIDKDAIRIKFGIPSHKDILIYLPYTFSNVKKHPKSHAWQAAFAGLHIKRRISKEFENNVFMVPPLTKRVSNIASYLLKIIQESEARKWGLNGWNEPAVISAVRKFCDRNELYLVVKPRRKFDFSEAVYNLADLIIDDDESQQYPSKLQELFSVAKICMGYFSTALIESIYCDTAFINLQCPDELFYDPHQHYWCPTKEGALFSLSGAAWNITIPEFIRSFGSATLSEYHMNQEKRREYMHKFTGSDNPYPAVNMLDVLEQRLHT